MVLYLLGPLGREVLEFYIAHSAVINGLVVIYALVLLLARRNLARIEARAAAELAAHSPGGPSGLSSFPPGFSWPDIIRQSSFFPFVAGPNHWIPRLSRPGQIESLSPLSRLLERIEGPKPPGAP
jgi:hypothetical protein